MRNSRLLTASLATCLALGLAACGSSSDSSPSQPAEASSQEAESPAAAESSAASTAAAAVDCLAESKATVDAALQEPALTVPSPAFEMSVNKGKKVWAINILTNQFIETYSGYFEEAARAAGMEPTIFDGKGQVAEWNKGIEQAINQGADGIAIVGINLASIGEKVQEARDAGIAVIDVLNSQPDAPLEYGLQGHVTSDYQQSGATLAAWALNDKQCEAGLGVLYTPDVAVWEDLQVGAISEMNRLCPECTAESEIINIADIAVDSGRAASTMLTKNPDINVLFATGDSFVTFVEPAATQVRPDITIMGFDALDANVESIAADSGAQKASVGSPVIWESYATIDQLGRAMAGLELTQGLVVPSRLIDKSNAVPGGNLAIFPAFEGTPEAFTANWAGE